MTLTVNGVALTGAQKSSINADLGVVTSTDLAAAISGKADSTALASALATKVDTSTLTTALTLKADASAVATSLSTKVDQTVYNTAIALKANQVDLTSGLSAKLDASALASAISGKADASSTVAVNASRNLTSADNGKVLELTAVGIALTVPTGLIASTFSCRIIAKAGATVVSSGGSLLNDGTATVTLGAGTFSLIGKVSAADSYMLSSPASVLTAQKVAALDRIYSGPNLNGRLTPRKVPIATTMRVDIDAATTLMAPTTFLEGWMPFGWGGDTTAPEVKFKNGAHALTGMTPFRIFCALEVVNREGGGLIVVAGANILSTNASATKVYPLYCQGQLSAVMPAQGGAEIEFELPPYILKRGETATLKWHCEHPTDPGNSTITLPVTFQSGGETNSSPLLVGGYASGAGYYTGAWVPAGTAGYSTGKVPATAPWTLTAGGAHMFGTKFMDKYTATDTTPNVRHYALPGNAFYGGCFGPVQVQTADRSSPTFVLATFGDSLNSQNVVGWVDYLAKRCGAVTSNFNRPGSGLGDFPNAYRGRQQMAKADAGANMHFHNDQSTDRCLAMWAWMRTRFNKVIQIGPSWDLTNVANFNLKSSMALSTTGVTRQQVRDFEAWCRTQVGTATGPDEFYSMADVCYDPADGLCYVDGTGIAANGEHNVNDGIHLNDIGSYNTGYTRAYDAGYKSIFQ